MGTINIKDFTKLYFDALLLLFSNVQFNILNDSTIEGRLEDKNIRISTENAYKEYQVNPDSLEAILRKYVSVANKLFDPRATINPNRIVPIIKPIEYLEESMVEAKKMGVASLAQG